MWIKNKKPEDFGAKCGVLASNYEALVTKGRLWQIQKCFDKKGYLIKNKILNKEFWEEKNSGVKGKKEHFG